MRQRLWCAKQATFWILDSWHLRKWVALIEEWSSLKDEYQLKECGKKLALASASFMQCKKTWLIRHFERFGCPEIWRKIKKTAYSWNQVRSSLKYEARGKNFLDYITDEETWCQHFIFASKAQHFSDDDAGIPATKLNWMKKDFNLHGIGYKDLFII